MKRALVLGGGGAVGIGWETGILAGLLERGVDVRNADLIVGTSAGSVVGTQIAGGRDARELMREQSERKGPAGNNMPSDPSHVIEAFKLWASFEEMTPERCAQIGRVALQAKTVPEDQWVAQFAENVTAWPEPALLITAVDCESGAFRTIDRAQGVPIERAIAASCSVPGMFPSVEIEGRRYTDGGVRSSTSADVAASIQPGIVLVLAPMAKGASGVGGLSARQVEQERAQLEAQGAAVRVVVLEDALQPRVANAMDPDAGVAAAEGGYEHGLRLADQIREWWRG